MLHYGLLFRRQLNTVGTTVLDAHQTIIPKHSKSRMRSVTRQDRQDPHLNVVSDLSNFSRLTGALRTRMHLDAKASVDSDSACMWYGFIVVEVSLLEGGGLAAQSRSMI